MKKSYILFCLFSVLLTGLMRANAADFRWQGADVNFESILSVSAGWRLESPNPSLIGKTNSREYLNAPLKYKAGSKNVPNGAWSNNSDEGNLNFDQGFFKEIVKLQHNLDMRFDNYGLVAECEYFYDYAILNKEINNSNMDETIKNKHGMDFNLLDTYLYGQLNIKNRYFKYKVGQQRIMWGEGLYIAHGITGASPINDSKLKMISSEIKNALIPVSSLWVGFDLTDIISLEGYYRLKWEQDRIDSPGTYFSTNDYLEEGGNPVQLSFGQNPDVKTPYYNWAAQRSSERFPSDSGQFGLKLHWHSENIYRTEFDLYYLNYHSYRPILSMYTHDINHIVAFSEYPEDIRLYGMASSLMLPGKISLKAQCAYRQNEPFQIDDAEVFFKAYESMGKLSPIPIGTSQIASDVLLGQEISGFRRLDTVQYNMSLTKVIFGTKANAMSLALAGEVGVLKMIDMPNPDELRFDAPGTDRSGNLKRAGRGLWYGEPEGVETSSFADEMSWGYVLMSRLNCYNIHRDLNVAPSLIFSHDVKGTTANPIALFVENRKSLSFNINFDYSLRWLFDIGYKTYWGGGNANQLSDRDFIYATIRYSM